ncbi:MAG TPA: hypothetical protein VI583_04670, partial [Cyclobacteriaceae bacterium]|nr:hypothetical protein [Cyclobacteriaceae bacterium]
RLSIGGSVGFSSQKFTETTNMFLLGVNARKHFSLAETVAWFIQGGINFGVGGDDNSSITSLGIAFRPGILVFITPKIGLESGFGSLGYQAYSVKPDGGSTSTTSTYGLNLNSNTLFFGFRYYFN